MITYILIHTNFLNILFSIDYIFSYRKFQVSKTPFSHSCCNMVLVSTVIIISYFSLLSMKVSSNLSLVSGIPLPEYFGKMAAHTSDAVKCRHQIIERESQFHKHAFNCYASLWLCPAWTFIACERIQTHKHADTQQWNAAEPVFLDAVLLRHRSIVLLTAAVKYQGVFETGLWHPFVRLIWIQACREETWSRCYSLSRCCTCGLSCLLRRKKEHPETEHMKVWGAQCVCSAQSLFWVKEEYFFACNFRGKEANLHTGIRKYLAILSYIRLKVWPK